jgi:hypothetical protein
MTSTDLKTGVVGGLGAKAPCRVATTTNITLEGLQTINGIPVNPDDRVLVKDQDDPTENGIRIVSTGEWQRAVDFDDELDGVEGTLVLAVEGSGTLSAAPNSLFVVESNTFPINFGVSEITFAYFATATSSGGVGTFLISTNNLDDVNDEAQARINLGLEIGSDVQAFNENLESLSGVAGAANELLIFSAPEELTTISLDDFRVKATTTTDGVSLLPKPITISNNILTPNSKIDFTAGNIQFDDGSGQTTFSAQTGDLAKNFGTDDGMLDVGTVAINTIYYLFVVYNPTTKISKPLASTSLATPSLPVGYTQKKYIGSLGKTNSSGNIRSLSQDNINNFRYKAPIVDRAGANMPTSPTSLTLSVPINCIAKNTIYVAASGAASGYGLFCPKDATNLNASSTNYNMRLATPGGSEQAYSFSEYTKVDSNSQVNIDATSAFAVEVQTCGWIDTNL